MVETMAKSSKKKVFYQVDEACERLGLSLLDMAVLVSDGRIQLSATVGRLLVEDGHYKVAPDETCVAIPDGQREVQGLVDLRAEDAWYVLRAGSQMIFGLAAEDGRYKRLISTGEDDRGYSVIREEVGVRHDVFARYAAIEEALEDVAVGAKIPTNRGSQAVHEWDAGRLEACRWIYFEGVPDSFGALIRHMQAWFAARGGKVPDESTLKRRLRDIWVTFGPEAKPGTKD